VRVDGHWLILDNRTMRLIADADIADLSPIAMLGAEEPSPSIIAAPAPESWDSAEL